MALPKQSKLDQFFTKRPEPATTCAISDSASGNINPEVSDNPHLPNTEICAKFKIEQNVKYGHDPVKYINRSLTDDERYELLTYKPSISSNYNYPANEQKRRYNLSWEENRPWLRYSPSDDSAFCAMCIAFPSSDINRNPELIKVGFNDWKNAVGEKRGMLNSHEKSERHKASQERCELFLLRSEGNSETIAETLSKAYHDKIEQNLASLISIIDIIIRLGQRNIAFRGNWLKDKGVEDGNFHYFINWKATFDNNLKFHLENSQHKYLSPAVQNEFISLCGSEIRDSILERCEKSEYFSVIADESTDVSTQAQLSICIRYVYSENECIDGKTNRTIFKVTEDFVGFVELQSTNAETISGAILQNLGQKWRFDLQKLRGQEYDGCLTMAGEVSGVQKRIKDEYPDAKYFVHCSSHRLNLVIVNSCNAVPHLRNVMAILCKLTWFMCGSSKRKNIIKEEMKQNDANLDFDLLYENEEALFEAAENRHNMPTLSETRWTARVDALSWLLRFYSSLFTALETVNDKSTGQSSADAMSYHASLLKFEFIVAVVNLQYILGYIRPLSVMLQARDCDYIKAHEEARNLVSVMENIRVNMEVRFHELFERAFDIANVQPTKPRQAARQQHRPNAAADTVEIYYRVNMFLPFLDHVIDHLNSRFPEDVKPMFYGTYLIPSNIGMLQPAIVHAMRDVYGTDLPSADNLSQEIERWVNRCRNGNINVSSLLETINLADKTLYPNIHAIIKLLLTIPAGSCSCERSFSAMRRLKVWNRATMTGDRFCSLAMLHIHRDDGIGNVSPKKILKKWDSTGTRKISLAFEQLD